MQARLPHHTQPVRAAASAETPRHNGFRHTPLAIALHLALLGGASGLVGGFADAHAQTAPAATAQAAARSYDIPAGPLNAALSRFAGEAGVLLAGNAGLVEGKRSPGLKGSYSVQAGFAALLAGTGLEAFRQGDGSYGLRTVPVVSGSGEVQLAPVTVTADLGAVAGELPEPYAGGQVARGGRLGMLGNRDLFETPFNAKSYTSEYIKNQNARGLNDVVATDPSLQVALSSTSALDQMSIRGFVIFNDSYLFDGLSGFVGYNSVPINHFERVEVLKGPSSAVNGAGFYGSGVGGLVNLVPKRAGDNPNRSISIGVRDKDLISTHIDAGQRFGEAKQFGARVNLTTENGDFYTGQTRTSVAPQVALDYRGDNIRVVLDAGLNRYKLEPAFTHYTLRPDATVPDVPNPRTLSVPKWSTIDLQDSFGLLTTEWDFTDNWTAYARHGRNQTRPTSRIYHNGFQLNSAGEFTATNVTAYTWKSDNEATDIGVRGNFSMGSTHHGLALSALRVKDHYYDERWQSVELDEPFVGSLYQENAVPNPFAAGVPNIAGVDFKPTILTSFAVADTVSMLDDNLTLIAAVRHQNIEDKESKYSESRTSPTLGVIYKLTAGFSVYGNYAESLAKGSTAPITAANAGENLPPFVSQQSELGVKWDAGEYGITLAYFDITRPSAFVGADNVFRADGEQRNQGVELETFGEPLPGFRLLGGVTWIDALQRKTEGGVSDGKKALGVPDLTLKLGAEYDLKSLQGLTFTGRYIHTGDAYADAANTQKIPAWDRVDLGVRYSQKLASGQHLILRGGIENVLDNRYWSIGGRNAIHVGAPRAFSLSATVDF